MDFRIRTVPLLIQVALLLQVRFFGLVISFLLVVCLARFLGPIEYGKYAFAISLYLIIEPLAGGGLATIATREMALSELSSSARRQLQTEFLLVVSFSSFVVAAISALFFTLTGVLRFEIAILGLLVLPGALLLQTTCGALQGQGLVKSSQIVGQVGKPAAVLGLLTASYWLANFSLHAGHALFFLATGGWLMLLVALQLSPATPALNLIRFPSRARVAGLLRMSVPFALVTSLQYFQTRVDMVCIGLLMDDQDVGYYQVATRVGQLASMPSSVVAMYMMPRFSRLYNSGSVDFLRLNSRKAQVVAAFISIASFLVLYVLASPLIIWIFGPEYALSIEPLGILLIAQMVMSLAAVPTVLISMTGGQGRLVRLIAVTALMNTIGNLILIQFFGLVGAALSTALCGLITLAGVWILARKKIYAGSAVGVAADYIGAESQRDK